eukprot:c27565_g1_i1 orf=1014-3680(-)
MGSTEEPERKRRHIVSNNNALNSPVSPPLKKQSLQPPTNDKKVDAAMLQYQNQKLTQQLDVQRSEIHSLEAKFSHLQSKQASYDNNLASVHNVWEKLVDNLELLASRANASANGLNVLQSSLPSKDNNISPVLPEETFLHRLLETGATESSSGSNGHVKELTLQTKQAATTRTIEHLVQAIDTHRLRQEELFSSLKKELSTDKAGQLLQTVDENLRQELQNIRSALDALHLKHKELSSEVRLCRDNHARDQAEIKQMTGELEETLLGLETIRQKLAGTKKQKDNVPLATSGLISSRKSEAVDKANGKLFKETNGIEAALEEAKTLASQRLIELQEAQKEKLVVSQQIRKMQDILSNEDHICLSQPYLLLIDQVQHLRIEVERYQSILDQSQADHDKALCHEKEANLKAEAGEAAQKVATIYNATISDIESKLHQCIMDRDELQLKLEEISQSSERKDEVTEFKVMVSTLHKEMCMMQQQLNNYKEAACGAHSLQADVQSVNAILDRKTNECKSLLEKVADQGLRIDSLKDEVRLLRESEQELKLILDMYGRESTDLREVQGLKQAECRAWAQVERLKAALDEHTLELRVKAAIEAEAACQQKLAAAEAEIAELRQRIDASERDVLELNEALRTRSEEGDAYLTEIETIGQAYEDMQTQNQRLLQQISERDDYNMKLVSENIKTKQLQTSLVEEKQDLMNRIHHANLLGDCYKQRVARLEEQARQYLDQLGKATDESKQYASALELAKKKSGEAEKELLSAKSALEAAQKELEQRRHKMADIQAELEKEKFEKKRSQEELLALTARAVRLNYQSDGGGSLVEKLQEEIKEYKAILKCGVCHDRPKEVVIMKCFHLFCSPCIQRNLEIRHRKCPGCGVPFGQNDVRNVYI